MIKLSAISIVAPRSPTTDSDGSPRQTTVEFAKPRRRRLDGSELIELIRALFPICGSITGDGLRQSLAKVGELLPLAIHEVATDTKVFDWTVPKEWNIRDAYIKDAAGRRVVDFQQCNLHVVNYSAPVNARMSLKELMPHLHGLPEHPDWIPYRTSYYAESWDFCLSQRQLESLPDGEYEVVIDSTLQHGSLSYGECVLPGHRGFADNAA